MLKVAEAPRTGPNSLAGLFPVSVGIETINTCNARCPFCPLFQGNSQMERAVRPAKVMDQALFEKVVAEIASWERKPETIWLNMNGEPLSDPLFAKRLQTLKAHGLNHLVNIQTNAHFMDDEAIDAILAGEIDRMTIGFDGATKETYEISRARCNYEKTLGNIKRLAEKRSQVGENLKITIQYVRMKFNHHETLPAYEMFREFLSPELDYFNDTLSKRWGDTAPENDDQYLFKPNYGPHVTTGCQTLESQMIICSDGTLQACCWDYNLNVSEGGLGKAQDTSALGVWRGERRAKLRDLLRTSDIAAKPEKCQGCSSMYINEELSVADAILPDKGKVSASPYGYIYRF